MRKKLWNVFSGMYAGVSVILRRNIGIKEKNLI